MDNVAVGPGQGPGSSAAVSAEPAAETAEELAAQLASDDVLRDHAQPLLLSVFGEDVRLVVGAGASWPCTGVRRLRQCWAWQGVCYVSAAHVRLCTRASARACTARLYDR